MQRQDPQTTSGDLKADHNISTLATALSGVHFFTGSHGDGKMAQVVIAER